jgi:hypothetical protein
MRSPSVRSTRSGSAVAGSPLTFALVAVSGRPAARQIARATSSAGTRTPTRPVPPVTSRASAARRRDQQRQRSRPVPFGQPRGRRRQRAEVLDDLPGIRGDERQRALGVTPFHHEHARDRGRRERIGRQAVERVGRHRHDAAVENPLRRFLNRITLRRSGVHDHTTHLHIIGSFPVFIVRCTVTASSAINARSTRKTMRIDAPPRSPAMNGLLAMPTSEALVRTPKPAPWAPGGITAPAAL